MLEKLVQNLTFQKENLIFGYQFDNWILNLDAAICKEKIAQLLIVWLYII